MIIPVFWYSNDFSYDYTKILRENPTSKVVLHGFSRRPSRVTQVLSLNAAWFDYSFWTRQLLGLSNDFQMKTLGTWMNLENDPFE